MKRAVSLLFATIAITIMTPACGSTPAAPPTPPACDDKCKDGVAIKAIREMCKLAFNVTLQGKPVGTHDEQRPCPLGGTARVFGTATSNAVQGATEVKLTYVMTDCGYYFEDDDAEDNYSVKLTGTITQEGIIAVQPSSTSAIIMASDNVKLSGTVYDPPLPYEADCPIQLGQNGNKLTGKLCDRDVMTDL